MNTKQDHSQSDLPSPIIETSKNKSKRSMRKQRMQSLEESESISSKEDNSLLENLSKIEEKKQNTIAQSIQLQREWHPVDYKSDIFADTLRNDNNNQSKQIDIEMKQSGKDKVSRRRPLNQPVIGELEDSIYLQESQMKESKILNTSLNRIKENKDREWIEPKSDIFDDPELDDSPVMPSISNKQRKKSITINYVEKNQQEKVNPNLNSNINHQQMNNMPYPNLAHAVQQNIMNTWHASSQKHPEFQPKNNFLHPQINNLHQAMQMHLNSNFNPNLMNSSQPQNPYQPLQNFNNPMPQMPNSHSVHFAQNNIGTHPPSPRSQAAWTQPQQQLQNSPQNIYQHQYPLLPSIEIMSEIRYLREEVRMLREDRKEDRFQKTIEKLQQKLKGQSVEILRERKGSESYEKSTISYEMKTLLDDQEKRHEQSMRKMQQKFMEKIQLLQKQQRSLIKQNGKLQRKPMFKHTDSHQFVLSIPEQVIKTVRLSRRKSSVHNEPQQNARFNRRDDFLKDKLSILRKQSPLKKPVHKRKNTEPKSNKNFKKDKFSFY